MRRLVYQIIYQFTSSVKNPRTSFSYEEFVQGLIKKEFKKIAVLTGAGISTAAGIPDFRSPDGLYSKLGDYNLPYQEAVFEISYFKQNPFAFYRLTKEFFKGDFKPAIPHRFIKYLQDQNTLLINFTQNIDGLENLAGINKNKLVQAHGSYASASCIRCGKDHDMAYFNETIAKENTLCKCTKEGCGGLVKPDIVFFGERLPPDFYDRASELEDADLGIIMGTSLVVGPFNQLVYNFKRDIPVVIINWELPELQLSNPQLRLLGDMCTSLKKLEEDLNTKF